MNQTHAVSYSKNKFLIMPRESNMINQIATAKSNSDEEIIQSTRTPKNSVNEKCYNMTPVNSVKEHGYNMTPLKSIKTESVHSVGNSNLFSMKNSPKRQKSLDGLIQVNQINQNAPVPLSLQANYFIKSAMINNNSPHRKVAKKLDVPFGSFVVESKQITNRKSENDESTQKDNKFNQIRPKSAIDNQGIKNSNINFQNSNQDQNKKLTFGDKIEITSNSNNQDDNKSNKSNGSKINSISHQKVEDELKSDRSSKINSRMQSRPLSRLTSNDNINEDQIKPLNINSEWNDVKKHITKQYNNSTIENKVENANQMNQYKRAMTPNNSLRKQDSIINQKSFKEEKNKTKKRSITPGFQTTNQFQSLPIKSFNMMLVPQRGIKKGGPDQRANTYNFNKKNDIALMWKNNQYADCNTYSSTKQIGIFKNWVQGASPFNSKFPKQ